ncbi:TnsA endonuclease N-terminal domain-containing protein [Streptomyces roseifaciens]|uniref:TnsA endonuclease N-terminal domain-containing protein n=1 Tax=Streptomyces roseifaciens TaxID=1488406 RepID=UPI000A701DE6|nr:TnsA endonuclease N-terminal domain-containing protein [Streptomyces roseifaciens]
MDDIPVPERRGRSWSAEEYGRLVDGIAGGLSVEELADRHQRSITAMRWAARQLVPPDEAADGEAADGEAAVAWLTERLASGAYDWQARLAENRQLRAAARKEREAAGLRGKRERPSVCEPSAIAGVWQEVTGHRLSPERRAEFLARKPLRALGAFPVEALRPVAERLWQADGRLLLEAWLLDTVCPGYATTDLSWEAVAGDSAGTATVLRDLVAAAVDELRDARAHSVLCRRLGLEGHEPSTQQAIGQEFSRTRQRISQLQARGITRMLGSREPATVALREALGDLLGPERAHDTPVAQRLPAVAEVALPGVPLDPGGLVLARLAGYRDEQARSLLKEAVTALAERHKEERRQQRTAERRERASRRWAALAEAADWFGASGPGPAPAREELAARRSVRQREHSGVWFSGKLGREVQYESVTELRVVQLLDHADQVAYFQEQPLALGYTHAGRRRSYYPDFLAVTTDGRTVLIEAKPRGDIPLAINQAKHRAAAGLCRRKGWGLLVTDGARTRADLVRHPVDPELERRIGAALASRELTWPDVRDIARGIPFTSLDLAALVLRNDWHWELGPYRLRADRGPQPVGSGPGPGVCDPGGRDGRAERRRSEQ